MERCKEKACEHSVPSATGSGPRLDLAPSHCAVLYCAYRGIWALLPRENIRCQELSSRSRSGFWYSFRVPLWPSAYWCPVWCCLRNHSRLAIRSTATPWQRNRNGWIAGGGGIRARAKVSPPTKTMKLNMARPVCRPTPSHRSVWDGFTPAVCGRTGPSSAGGTTDMARPVHRPALSHRSVRGHTTPAVCGRTGPLTAGGTMDMVSPVRRPVPLPRSVRGDHTLVVCGRTALSPAGDQTGIGTTSSRG